MGCYRSADKLRRMIVNVLDNYLENASGLLRRRSLISRY